MVRTMASAKEKREGGCGHVKSNTLIVIRKPLEEHVFVLEALQRPPVTAHFHSSLSLSQGGCQ